MSSTKYSLLPEWAIHKATWISMPRQHEVWGGGLTEARELLISVANTLVEFEPVVVMCSPGQPAILRRYLDARITLLENSSDELWLRDASPIYAEGSVFGGKTKIIPLQFSTTRAGVSSLAKRMAGWTGKSLKRIPLSLSDGDFSVDGTGSMLLCRKSLLSKARIQPSEDSVVGTLNRNFGIDRIIWLSAILETDPRQQLTNLARFIAPSKVLLANHPNHSDPNMIIAQEAYNQLTSSNHTNADGRAYNIYRIKNPYPLRLRGRALCASYLNYYLGNGVVCIPAFYKPSFDEAAKDIFKTLFPDYAIHQFQVLPLLSISGGLHCVTRQWPISTSECKQLKNSLKKFDYEEQHLEVPPMKTITEDIPDFEEPPLAVDDEQYERQTSVSNFEEMPLTSNSSPHNWRRKESDQV